jgi:hypothetical protein
MSCLLAFATIGLHAGESIPWEISHGETREMLWGPQTAISSWKIRLLAQAHHMKKFVSGKVMHMKKWAKVHKTPLIAATAAIVAMATFYVMRTYCVPALKSFLGNSPVPPSMNTYEQALFKEAQQCAYPVARYVSTDVMYRNVGHCYDKISAYANEHRLLDLKNFVEAAIAKAQAHWTN